MWTALRVVFLVVAISALVPWLARAQTQRVHVRIALSDQQQATEREALLRVLPELMQRLAVELVVDPKTDAQLLRNDGSPYLATCLVDLRAADEAVLYVHDPARDRILERRVTRTAGGEELVREELGHMLLAAVEALLAGATVGAPSAEVHVPEAQVPLSLPPPVAPPPQTRALARPEPREDDRAPIANRWAVRTALLYELTVLGDAPGVSHGPELALALRSPLPLQLGALLSAQYRFAFELPPDPVGMRSQTFALRALATVEHALGARTALRFGLGAGADIVRITPQLESNARVAGTQARTLTLGVARALVGFDLRISSALSLWAALAADVDLDRSQFVLVQSNGDESLVSEPWRARPAFLLGAALP